MVERCFLIPFIMENVFYDSDFFCELPISEKGESSVDTMLHDSFTKLVGVDSRICRIDSLPV